MGWLRGLRDEVWATRFRKRAASACVWAGAAFSCLQYGLVFPGHSGASVCGFPALCSGPAVRLERKKKVLLIFIKSSWKSLKWVYSVDLAN